MPLGNYEYIQINKNAAKLKKDLIEKAKQYNIDDQILNQAQEYILHYSQQTINELYEYKHKV